MSFNNCAHVCDPHPNQLKMRLLIHSKYTFDFTVIPWCSSASELVKPCTCHILMRKNVLALGAGSGLIALARTCLSHDAAPQEEMLHHS